MSDELNGTMMQYFHWYSPDDGSFWDEVVERAAELAQAGFTGVWLPPAVYRCVAATCLQGNRWRSRCWLRRL